MKARFALIAALIVVFAPRAICAQVPASIDPVGSYDLLFESSEHQQPGELTITRSSDGKVTGSLLLHGHVIPLESVVAHPGKAAFTASAPDGHFKLTLVSDGKDSFTGTFSAHSMSGTLAGTRRK